MQYFLVKVILWLVNIEKYDPLLKSHSLTDRMREAQNSKSILQMRRPQNSPQTEDIYGHSKHTHLRNINQISFGEQETQYQSEFVRGKNFRFQYIYWCYLKKIVIRALIAYPSRKIF